MWRQIHSNKLQVWRGWPGIGLRPHTRMSQASEQPMTFSSRRPPQGPAAVYEPGLSKRDYRNATQSQIRDPEAGPGCSLIASRTRFDNPPSPPPAMMARGRDDTFVITGDIDSMWLRDSTAPGVAGTCPCFVRTMGFGGSSPGIVHRQVAWRAARSVRPNAF